MVVAIEGSIGIGKSTVLRELGHKYSFFEEQVSHWTLLKQFYAHPQKFSFVFQLQVMASYAEVDDSYDFVERSAMSALGVFSSMLVKSGAMTQEQLQMLYAIYSSIPHRDPDHFIYLKASPALCLERMAWRAREGERLVTLEYLQRVEEAYELFFSRDDVKGRVTVLEIQANETPAQVAARIQAVVEALPPNNK